MKKILCGMLLALATTVYAENQLVTSAGNYAPKESAFSLALTSSDSKQLKISVEWRKEKPRVVDGGWSTTTQSETSAEPTPVVPGHWAFYFSGTKELWFFDGDGLFTCWEGTPDGLKSSQSCSDAKLPDRAPEELKKWIAKKKP